MSFPTIVRRFLVVTAVLAIGLLAGILVGTGMDQLAARSLPQASWVLWAHAGATIFPRTMPWVFNSTLLFLIAAAIVTRGFSRSAFALAALLAVATILITIRGEVPINHVIAAWTPQSVPADWSAVRDHWLANHLARTLLGVVAFLCATTALRRVPGDPPQQPTLPRSATQDTVLHQS